ncbi:MAG: sigma-70 family RNA polymerase sigma factor [Bacteroidota bacterium]
MYELGNIDRRVVSPDGMLTGMDDLAVLIKECIAESRSAQKKLYDLYSPAAYGVIKRYIYNDEFTAQEILNDAFFKVLTKLGQFSFQGPIEGWIRRIVVNTVTDHLRKNIKEEHNHKELQAEDAFIQSDSIDRLSKKELLLLVQSLPEMQRAVFNLFVFENFAHKEISALMNLSENNSRWYLNDARRRLKEKINFILK